ncbi:helicase C-terminal domain-containing protein [Vibrio fluvialis]|nr:helicase C-terminal domain-containing protein [Vibrio fluvialis]
MNGSEQRDLVVLKTLREELVGPCPYGDKFSWEKGQVKKSQLNVPLRSASDGEEILKTYPLQRYGISVLYPINESDLIESGTGVSTTESLSKSEEESSEPLSLSKQNKLSKAEDVEDFDISLSNARLPSSMGMSFLINAQFENSLHFELSGAFYRQFTVKSEEGHTFNWWKRDPVKVDVELNLNSENGSFKLDLNKFTVDQRLANFHIEGVLRTYRGQKIVTVAIVNRNRLESSGAASYKEKNERSLFQSELKVRIVNAFGEPVLGILPYPSQPSGSFDDLSEDDQSNELLYRISPSFGKGHGVAVDWNVAAYETCSSVSEIYTQALPTFETPSITAEIENSGNSLRISMAALANFEVGSDGEKQLDTLTVWYSDWIKTQIESKNNIKHVDPIMANQLVKQADKHIDKCKLALIRISEGLEKIKTDEKARRAFRLANEAMFAQQKRAPKKIRKAQIINEGIEFEESYRENPNAKGIWRPFQIGFLLMCICGAVDQEIDDHEIVDLIWFPTGGGKTEAYLGLAAFTLIYSRLTKGSEAEGVQILMRYTLRLLTAQQLQRAATLICCLEVIRRANDIPGKPFSIGLWVGSKNTPNKRKMGVEKLKKLKKSLTRKGQTENPFLLDRCPYCGAQMGICGTSKENRFISGYKHDKAKNTVKFECEDFSCSFKTGIPVFIIDEDIYDEKPSIVIGTVDKFAMLAWEPKVRSIFGINDQGKRELLPPQLIIQDELHLITGPLGTMVGHYEPLIEELCSYSLGNDKRIKPKIVCATATTKGYKEQVKSIYGRVNTEIFPPPGLSSEDSFFSKYERDLSGNLTPGRKYVGVCAPGLGSILTTQVRTHSALLFSSNRLDIKYRDPWVSLLSFYNSIRELGGALTLFQADIISYLLELKRRYPDFLLPRFINGGMELTSRLKDDEIPNAITLLERELRHKKLDDAFYGKLCKELEETKILHPESKDYIEPLVDKLKNSNELGLEDYSYLDKLNTFYKNQELKLPANFMTIQNLLRARDVTPFCLASSIIEVGIDIDRLSLMSIVGQPKTTAQYIQVSGRVGRRAFERPGLVTTIYNNAKPRDKSHYEDFRSYHQKLYAQVEPSSVTPYSRPAIDRGFSAQMIAYARQFSPINSTPKDISFEVFNAWFDKLLKLREEAISPDERKDLIDYFQKKFKRSWDVRGSKCETWGHLKPNAEPEESDIICPLGATGRKMHQFECPTSMRNVDGESIVWISPQAYEVPEDDDYFGEW